MSVLFRAHLAKPSTTRSRPFSRSSNMRSVVQQAAVSNSPDVESSVGATSTSALTYTSYESNTFNMKFTASGVSMLVDPWLVGDLMFMNAPLLFRGKKSLQRRDPVDLQAVSAQTDVMLITQALDDHFHEQTLQCLPKTLPIVAAPEAAERAKRLGYQNVASVDHGQTITTCDGKLQITGTIGALVGPPWSKRQNGFVIKEVGCKNGITLYYEPHCDFDEASVKSVGQVDIVVSPVQSQLLNLGLGSYPLVMGGTNLVPLLKLLNPKVVVALENGNIDMEGLLAGLVKASDTVADAEKLMAQQGCQAKLVLPTSRQPLDICIN